MQAVFSCYLKKPLWQSLCEKSIQKVTGVTDNLVPYKNKRVQDTSQDWFDANILEKTRKRDKLFKNFKKSCLHVNNENFQQGMSK